MSVTNAEYHCLSWILEDACNAVSGVSKECWALHEPVVELVN